MSHYSPVDREGETLMKSLEVGLEERATSQRKLEAVYRALEFELAGSVEAGGSILIGLSAKMSAWDCLLTLRAVQGGDKVVCFVGSDSLANCFLKAVRDAQQDMLRWKPDQY